MKRRELFAALGAIVGAAIVGKAVASETITTTSGGFISSGTIHCDTDLLISDISSQNIDNLLYDVGQASEFSPKWWTPRGMLIREGNLAYYAPDFTLPLADLANHPDDAKSIFEHIASSAYEFKSVQYTGFDQPRIILTGFSTVYGDAKVVITQSTIRYTTIKRNGQENTNDVRNQKVVEFIRGLGYEIQRL